MQPLEPPGATFKQRESLTTRLRNILDDYPAGLGPYARRKPRLTAELERGGEQEGCANEDSEAVVAGRRFFQKSDSRCSFAKRNI